MPSRSLGLIRRIRILLDAPLKRVEYGKGDVPLSDQAKQEYVAVRNDVVESLTPGFHEHMPLTKEEKATVESMADVTNGDLVKCYNTLIRLILANAASPDHMEQAWNPDGRNDS